MATCNRSWAFENLSEELAAEFTQIFCCVANVFPEGTLEKLLVQNQDTNARLLKPLVDLCGRLPRSPFRVKYMSIPYMSH